MCSFSSKNISHGYAAVCASLSLFWVGTTLGHERTMQTNLCGNLTEKCLLSEIFHLSSKVCGRILQDEEVNYWFCMKLCFVYFSSKKTTFLDVLMVGLCAAVEPFSRKGIQVSMCYILASTLIEQLHVKHEWAKRARQLIHFCEAHPNLTFFLLRSDFKKRDDADWITGKL